MIQPRQSAAHEFQAGWQILFTNEAEQPDLIHLTQPPGLGNWRGSRTNRHVQRRTGMVEPDAEKETFRQRRLRARLAQRVDGWKQQLGDFLATGDRKSTRLNSSH